MSREVLIGTRKGLFFIRDGALTGPELTGWTVFHATRDPRDGSLYVASNSWVYGGVVHRSTDDGQTWARSETIDAGGQELGEVWHVEPGHASEPSTVFLGAAPGLLLRSDDSGKTFRPVTGLVAHPTREQWHPGAGGMCTHSIQIDPGFPQRMFAAISAAGAFRTEDVPSEFGFPIMLDAADPDVAYVIPEEGAENRVTSDGRLGVYRTTDAGSSWHLFSEGLPEPAWTVVLREASSFDDIGPVFGTQSGSVWALEGETWHELARELPPVLSVEVA